MDAKMKLLITLIQREDNHHLTPNLWHQFNEGFYPLPRKDK